MRVYMFIKGAVDFKSKVMFMELRAASNRLLEELIIIQREMKAFLVHCGERIANSHVEQTQYGRSDQNAFKCYYTLENCEAKCIRNLSNLILI